MRIATETLLRYLAMLESIPALPNSRSTQEIRSTLKSINPDFDVNVRTIQRDLEKLSTIYPLACDTRGRTNFWYWADKASLVQLPSMSLDTALALRLAQDHLTPLIPPATLDLLTPYFKRAQDVLDDTNLARWRKKVRILNAGPPLQSPKIDAHAQSVIYQALLEERQFEATYSPRYDKPKTYPVNPLGLVSKNGVLYLVGAVYSYTDIRQFALHRFKKATLLTKSLVRPKGFNLDHYIEEEAEFDYPVSHKPVKIKATISDDIAFLLSERPLSKDQKVTKKTVDEHTLTATVKDTMELRWWIASQGEQIIIHSPKALK